MADHGTYTRYNQGCHCAPCREANNRYKKEHRKHYRLRESPLPVCPVCGKRFERYTRRRKICSERCRRENLRRLNEERRGKPRPRKQLPSPNESERAA